MSYSIYVCMYVYIYIHTYSIHIVYIYIYIYNTLARPYRNMVGDLGPFREDPITVSCSVV